MSKERTGSIVECKNGKLYARVIYKGEDSEPHDITRRAVDRKDARRIIRRNRLVDMRVFSDFQAAEEWLLK
jgi:hypothetical protein